MRRRIRQAIGIRRQLPPLLAILLAMAGIAMPPAGLAATPPPLETPAAPAIVRLFPSGAHLQVIEEAPVSTKDNISQIRILLPAGAEDFQVTVDGHSVARWGGMPQMLDAGGAARLRRAKQDEIHHVEAQLESVKSNLTLMGVIARSLPEKGSLQDMPQREKYLSETLPALKLTQAELSRRLEKLQAELAALPESADPLGQVMLITLGEPAATQHVTTRYSYTLENCGWRPYYVFNAQPGKDKEDKITVRFMAELWQHSGIDWNDAKLTLVSGGSGPREPARLPHWIIDSTPESRTANRSAQDDDMAAMEGVPAEKTPMLAAAAPKMARVEADTDSLHASWTPVTTGLAEGQSRLVIAEDEWKAPLSWLARPRVGDNRVWLMAKCPLPAGRVWPNGTAEFMVDGQSVGQGRFTPKGNEASLYFGPDPRVQVHATEDDRQRAEKGFLGKRREWSWAWTYIVSNTRDREVTVRLERPAPRIVDADITLKYNNTPEAQQDEREHFLFWNVKVPANGKADVKHSLAISSPKEMRMPVAP